VRNSANGGKMVDVVVTGIGMICALGADTSTIWKSLLDGDSNKAPIPAHWREYSDYQSQIWAPLPEIDYTRWNFNRLEPMRSDQVSMIAAACCHQALDQAGLNPVPKDSKGQRFSVDGTTAKRRGVFMGTGVGGINTSLDSHLYQATRHINSQLKTHLDDLPNTKEREQLNSTLERLKISRRFNPLAVTMLMPNAVSAMPAIRFGFSGPCKTYTSACASGTVAIGEAFRAVKNGSIDMALCGGAEYLYDEYGSIFRSYDITGALTKASSPDEYCGGFDESRSGFLFSQGGGAALIIESLDSAFSRGATPLAKITAFEETFDAHNMIAMDPTGRQIRDMLNTALDSATLTANDIDYINAHGTGTTQNDAIEAEIVQELFPPRPWINSSKSLMGHTIGASGALEAAVTVLSIHNSQIHPCGNLTDPMPGLNLPLVRQKTEIRHAISQSFAFGGHNSCLLFEQIKN
jgi:3-oxoacyl-[acyl-carrier-protein] synthase II